MGPKKDVKNVVEQPPKEAQPQLQPFELVGYGRFEYLNGVLYEGNWKLFKGIKMKHGYGRLLLPFDAQNGTVKQYFEGNWQEDKINGYGTYYYPDGTIYSGEWLYGKHHGRGRFTFANGTHYDGEWRNHQIHGSGIYVDHLGRQWEGEFRDGVFESRQQMELSKEKVLTERKDHLKQQIKATVSIILDQFQQQNPNEEKILSFFPSSELVKRFISGQLVNYNNKKKEQWIQLIKAARSAEITLLQHRVNCKTINCDRVLVRQQEGDGQIAEIFWSTAGKRQGLLFLQIQKCRWILAALNQEIP